MAERDYVRFGDTCIEYEIRRSERRKKTIEITVGHDGVRVSAPSMTSDDDLRKLVLRRASWILGHRSQWPEAAPKRFVSGETLPYLGPQRSYDLRDRGRALTFGPLRSLAVQDRGASGSQR